jgi:hypothetical protein
MVVVENRGAQFMHVLVLYINWNKSLLMNLGHGKKINIGVVMSTSISVSTMEVGIGQTKAPNTKP